MRYLMLLVLLFPVGLQAQEVDKQKLIQILQLPRTAVNFSFSYELEGPSGAKFPGYDQVLKAEINTLKSQLKNQAADWKLWSTIAEKCSLLSDEGELAKCRVKELACLRRWVKEQPDDEKGQIELINVLLCNPKDFDEAFLRASELVKNHANSSNAWATLGYYHLQKKSFAECRKAYEKAVALAPNDAIVHLAYAWALLKQASIEMFGKENLKIDDILEKRLSQERELQPDADERGVTDAASVTSSSLAPPGAGKTPTSFQVRRAEEMRALFRDIKDQAQQAFQLFKKNDPKNRSVLFALSTKLLAEGCENPLKSSIQQNFDIILDADFLQEVAHQVTLTPDEVALHANLFFGRFFAIARKCVEENRIKAIGDLMRLESTIKSILKPDELALLQQHLILEKRISGMTRENAAFAHQMLGPMGLILEELAFAEHHARLACELAPEREDNWLFLAGIFYTEKRSKEVFSLSEKWLQHHKTAKSYHCLALAAAQTGDWKRGQDFVVQGLKIDPKSPRLLLSEIVADLMLDHSAASVKKAKERLTSFHNLLQKEPKLSELVDRPDVYLISIVVYALNDELSQAQAMLDTMLQEQPSREEFQQLRQVFGIRGLQPPRLLKP